MKKALILATFILAFFSICCEKDKPKPDLSGVTFTSVKSIKPPYKLINNIVEYKEILGYDSTEYVFILSEEAGERIRKVQYPVSPTPFAIALDGEVIYIANFIPGYSSMSCETCITMEPYSADNKFRMVLGYPGSDYFTGPDPRNDTRLITRFNNDSKLIIKNN